MFKAYILPVLEFGSPIFNPYFAKDVKALEKVQRDFVKQVYRRSHKHHQTPETSLSYAEILAELDLELLEIRRLKICLAMFHNYLYGLVPIDPTEAFQILPSRTRGESHKFVCKPYTKDVRCNSFFPRISKIYSQLPPLVRNNPPHIFCKILNSVDLTPFLILKPDCFRNVQLF